MCAFRMMLIQVSALFQVYLSLQINSKALVFIFFKQNCSIRKISSTLQSLISFFCSSCYHHSIVLIISIILPFYRKSSKLLKRVLPLKSRSITFKTDSCERNEKRDQLHFHYCYNLFFLYSLHACVKHELVVSICTLQSVQHLANLVLVQN